MNMFIPAFLVNIHKFFFYILEVIISGHGIYIYLAVLAT